MVGGSVGKCRWVTWGISQATGSEGFPGAKLPANGVEGKTQ